jgi:hypothetical protein
MLDAAHVEPIHAIPPCAISYATSNGLTVDLILLVLAVFNGGKNQCGLIRKDETTWDLLVLALSS